MCFHSTVINHSESIDHIFSSWCAHQCWNMLSTKIGIIIQKILAIFFGCTLNIQRSRGPEAQNKLWFKAFVCHRTCLHIAFCKRLHSHLRLPLLIENSLLIWPLSTAMLVYQRVMFGNNEKPSPSHRQFYMFYIWCNKVLTSLKYIMYIYI